MNIQEMVDERVEKLRALQTEVSPAGIAEAGEDRPFDNISSDRRRLDLTTEEQGIPNLGKYLSPTIEELEFGELIDAALTEVAERVLMISDQVAGDSACIEKDILNSRLSVLQSAEKVLDIAISLRRKASSRHRACQKEMEFSAQYEDELQLLEIGQMDKGSFSNDGRASMHERGVASLFRRT